MIFDSSNRWRDSRWISRFGRQNPVRSYDRRAAFTVPPMAARAARRRAPVRHVGAAFDQRGRGLALPWFAVARLFRRYSGKRADRRWRKHLFLRPFIIAGAGIGDARGVDRI